MLTEEQYVELAEEELQMLLDALDDLDTDPLEAELANGILTLDFADEKQPIVVNSHRAARQIWMAADRSAWHFDWSPETRQWIAPKNGDELWTALRTSLSTRLGRPLRLVRPPS